MSLGSFLRLILPDTGFYIAATPFVPDKATKPVWWNYVVDDIPALQSKTQDWARENRDVYFALAAFKEREVVNLSKLDYKTNLPGKKEKRTQANVRAVRSLFLDLDVKPGATGHYDSQADALTHLKQFVKALSLPSPTLVNSGWGIHVYWPFTVELEPLAWKVIAAKLKSCCVHFGLHADPAVTSDEARVLRVPGTMNYKRNPAVPVAILRTSNATDPSLLDASLQQYVSRHKLTTDVTKVPLAQTPLRSPTHDNLGTTNDPLNPDALTFSCQAFAAVVANRGATCSEPQWRAALGLARFCSDSPRVMLAVSDGYPGFSQVEMEGKVANMTAGPTKCARFWELDNATCEACPHWQQIKSPASVSKSLQQAAPPPKLLTTGAQIIVPPLPYGYVRVKDAEGATRIVSRTEDEDGRTHDEMVVPYDLYPQAIMEKVHTDKDSEARATWNVVLPRFGDVSFVMDQAELTDQRKLQRFLLNHGMHITPKEAKAAQYFMAAYLRELAKAVDIERSYDHLGWHNKNSEFVMLDRVYCADGTTRTHAPSQALLAITRSAYAADGDLSVWRDALQFYAGEGNEPYRVILDTPYASPLFYMTGHKGVLIAASGDTGRGKTTVLEAAASVYGDPANLLIGGGRYGATMNATWAKLGATHSLPFFWDDTTDREPEEMREFMLHITNGHGKDRMFGNVHDGKVVSWRTMVVSSANTDDISRILSIGKHSAPQLMRYIAIDFEPRDRGTERKIAADKLKRVINENYGVAGVIYLQHIVKNRAKIQDQVLAEMARYDRILNAQSEERHWTATLACLRVGGVIAHQLNLSPFNPDDDEAWRVHHIHNMRTDYVVASPSAAEILTEFVEGNIRSTLILSSKSSSTVDNIVQKPQSALWIRVEMDNKRMFVSRVAMNEYCTKFKANFRKLEQDLVDANIILRRDAFKVLGADTPWSGGQTRCWEIDSVALEAATVKGAGND